VVVVAGPTARGLEGPPAGDDRPGRHALVDYLAVDAGQAARDCLAVGVGASQEPLVQAVPTVAEPVARSLIGPGDESVEGHGHVKNGCGHRLLREHPTLRSGDMTIQRMDNVLIVVDDLEAAKAFFAELGMELEGEAPVEGRWVDRVVGLGDVRADIAMMRTPDAHSRLELTKFHTPPAVRAEPE